MNKKTFGNQLKRLRESRGMTTEGLSAALGVNESEFVSWENGETLPSLEQAAMISNAFGVPLDELIENRSTFRIKESDDISEEEKAFLAEKIRRKSASDYKIGKIIVTVFVAIELILSILSCIITLDITSIVLNVIFFVLLYKGKPWARYFYIFIAAETVIGVFMVMDITASYVELVAYIIILVFRLAGALLFAFSRPVKEFLYGQYAG